MIFRCGVADSSSGGHWQIITAVRLVIAELSFARGEMICFSTDERCISDCAEYKLG